MRGRLSCLRIAEIFPSLSLSLPRSESRRGPLTLTLSPHAGRGASLRGALATKQSRILHRESCAGLLRFARNDKAKPVLAARLRTRAMPAPSKKACEPDLVGCGRRWFRLPSRSRPQDKEAKRSSPDAAERNPGTTWKLECRFRIALRSIRATKRKKGSGTPKDAVP
jgi:hypothetical protein